MRDFIAVGVISLAVLVTQVHGRLVPVPFLTQPPVQRLTKAVAVSLWGDSLFSQCHGIAGAALQRRAGQDGGYRDIGDANLIPAGLAALDIGDANLFRAGLAALVGARTGGLSVQSGQERRFFGENASE
jgi:hypothetical protein